MQFEITINSLRWVLDKKDNGWVRVLGRFGDNELYCHLTAIDIHSALQYVWAFYNNPLMKPLTVEDLMPVKAEDEN